MFEIVEDHDGYRAVYTVRFRAVVYVLHAFQKKSTKGVRTAQSDIDLIRQRTLHDETTRRAMVKPGIDETQEIARGSGNVFADLGYPDAGERQTKLRLAHALNRVIARRRLTQAAAAGLLGVNQPKVSALANYKLEGFSVERLMTFLTALDRDVEIVIRKKPRSRPAARISVVAA